MTVFVTAKLLDGSLRPNETSQRMAVEGVGLPGVAIPWAVLVIEDADGDND